MVRLVIGPNEVGSGIGSGRTLVPDLAGHLPGRGIWLSARGDVIETARVRGTLQRAIARAAGGSIVVPADLRERLAVGLERRIADLHSRAERAGRAVAACTRLNDLVRTEIERLAGLRSTQADGTQANAGDRSGTGAAPADEGTDGRVHDGRQ